MSNARVIRTVEYVGPIAEIEFLMSRVVPPEGLIVGHVQIRELSRVPADPIPRGLSIEFQPDHRYGVTSEEELNALLQRDRDRKASEQRDAG